MKIEYVIVQNFKSYIGIHRLGPFSNYSAIIGPNGSGKSNVFEAICFVLGANSTNLRCSRLESLFSTGLNPENSKCSVELQMSDNYSQRISLKREVIRNGSAYYINGLKSTTDEYKKNLSDLGFPQRFQSFVIFQGDIQILASMKPMDLTKLIEQVSHSDELKDDYEEAKFNQEFYSKALLEAEKDKELFSERKKVLKEEAIRTKEWIEKQKELEKVQLTTEDFKLFQLLNDHITSNSELQKHQDSLNDKRSQVQSLSEAINDTDSSINEARKSAKTAQKRLSKLKLQGEKAQSDFSTKDSNLEAIQQRIPRLDHEISQLKSKISEESKKKAQLSKSLSKFIKTNKVFIENSSTFTELYENIQFNDQKQNPELINLISHTEQQIFFIENEKQQISSRIESIQSLLITTSEQESLHSSTAASIKSKLSETEKEIDSTKSRISEISTILSEKRNTYSQLCHELNFQKAHKKRLSIITELRKSIDGVIGYLSDLITPAHSKYSEAISSSLFSYMDSIIVSNFDVATQCISYLNEHRLGSATFIPTSLHYEFSTPQCSLQPISSYIECSPSIQPIINYLTSGCFVVENGDPYSLLSNLPSYCECLIDLNGISYHRNGCISGGSYLHSYEFSNDLSSLEQSITESSSELDNLSLSLSSLEDTASELRYELNTNLRLSSTDHSSYEHLSNEFSQLNSRLQSLSEEESKARSLLSSTLVSTLNSSNIIADPESFSKYLLQRREAEEIKQQIAMLESSTLPEALKALINESSEVSKRATEAMIARAEAETVLENIGDKIIKAEKSLEECKSHVRAAEGQRAILSKKKTMASVELSTEERKVVDMTKESLKASSELELFIRTLGRKGLCSIEDLKEYSFENLFDRRELKEVMKPKEREKVIEKLEREKKELRTFLDEESPDFNAEGNLGELRNVVKVKRDVARKAAERHKKALGRLREVKRERAAKFNEVLGKMQKAIAEVYPLLTASVKFPLGGAAFLQSDDTSVPFECGTRFSVIPPNKRHRGLSALSGGEQTLAVLALIVACTVAADVPVIVMDEVDAALDRRNAEALAGFLERWARGGKKQIVVVSHKNEIFGMAESIIGVFRSKSGGSRTVTLRMENEFDKEKSQQDEPVGFL